MTRARNWILAICLAFGLLGCVGLGAEQDAVARYAENDMSCGDGEITMVKTAYRTYKVTGCGQEKTYSCDEPSYRSANQGCSAIGQ